ncbi:MAG: low molecular weight protein-tyrosine-phosphatase [Clostridia bacterium]|nr:low molecular weight protein-tyrosine-phosphatase [Clostridia bacterium]
MRILFVCTGNTCRSPMAKYLLEHLISQNNGNPIEVLSAGIGAHLPSPISSHASALLSEKHIDASSHQALLFTPDLVDETTVVLTMGASHKANILSRYPFLSGHVHTLAEYVNCTGDIADPFGNSLDVYRTCFMQLEKLITKLYLQI